MRTLADCRIDYNIYFHPNAKSEADAREDGVLTLLRAQGHDSHSRYGDPMFVDWMNADFRFQGDSPAIKMGIKPLDLNEVGLTKDFPNRLKK